MSNERERFEAWADEKTVLNLTRLDPPEDDCYQFENTDWAWVVWQAAQATPPAVEPVAWANSKEFHDALTRGQSFNGWHKKYSDCDMALFTTPPAEPTQEIIEAMCKAYADTSLAIMTSVNPPHSLTPTLPVAANPAAGDAMTITSAAKT